MQTLSVPATAMRPLACMVRPILAYFNAQPASSFLDAEIDLMPSGVGFARRQLINYVFTIILHVLLLVLVLWRERNGVPRNVDAKSETGAGFVAWQEQTRAHFI